MPDTGAPYFIPYVEPTDLVRDYPAADEASADAIAAALDGIPVLAGIGSNVVQTVKTDTFSTSSGTFSDVTGLTVTITPSSASSKILVTAQIQMGFNSTAAFQAAFFRLNGGNSDAYVGAVNGVRSRVAAGLIEAQMAGSTLAWMQPQTLVFLDSPATASAVTYAVQARIQAGGTAFINRPQNYPDNAAIWSAPSSITVIEVSA